MRSLDLVHEYFDREAERFDAIYDPDKPLLQKLGDAAFRKVIFERYLLVINAIGATGTTVLDVGCGSGRYGIELARRGARGYLGVDVSSNMIAIAQRQSDRTPDTFFMAVPFLRGCLGGHPTPCPRQGLRRGTATSLQQARGQPRGGSYGLPARA
jgi:ubiquinone/menaquinone biosynthesis C-methylase UbiE